MSRQKKSRIIPKGHVLIVTDFPPAIGGTSVVMHNLLSHFDPTSYSVAYVPQNSKQVFEDGSGVQKYALSPVIGFSSRLNQVLQQWWLPRAESKLKGLVERLEPRVIVGVYPQFSHLLLTQKVAKATNIPWIGYLHDTLAEALSGSKLASQAATLQRQTLAEASFMWVMSQGMADFYQQRYKITTQPLPHSYPEPLSGTLPEKAPLQQVFWGGGIYGINRNAVRRVSAALKQRGHTFVLSTTVPAKLLTKWEILGEHVQLKFYPKRADYLRALQQQSVLVLALDWPDESTVHRDELATIFPTKTPEYLASGCPILVHCPEDYFLARFIREHQCGIVVSERSKDALDDAFRALFQGGSQVEAMQRAALAAAHVFAPDAIAQRFQEKVCQVSQIKWAEKVQ